MGDPLSFRVAFKQQNFEMRMQEDETVAALKMRLSEETGIDVVLQKLLFKGMLKDDATLSDSKITNGSRVMLMASTAKDIAQVVTAPATAAASGSAAANEAAAKQSIFTETEHQKVAKRGKPDWELEKERTQKVSYSSVTRIQAEDMPSPEGDGYSAIGMQVGPTEKSTLWFYWVPKQYVENIKDAVMGQFPAAQYLLNQILNSSNP
ncbi:Ubiquitin domain-containing protein ubfd1 [Podochytrium sp. JEL0797]|nr:Ubiquitin domain-containing protein ubfd1 [Podochytrium sp. JEL0797]